MSTNCRVIKGGLCEITQIYKKGVHDGIDLTNKNHTFGDITAHSDGTVVGTRNDCKGFEQGSYGNYVKIKHDNGYYTLYAHGAYNTVKVNVGDRVIKNQVIMYMGNTGYSFGGHLHFEVRDVNDVKIDPTNYLNSDLPVVGNTPITTKHKLGDIVTINGVYKSSTSATKLKPLVKVGMITKIVENAKNPYLLNAGQIGWINDDCIIEDTFHLNDIVVPTKLVDVNGTHLVQYDKEYYIKDLKSNKATLCAKRDGRFYVWATLPLENIKKVR